MKSIVEFQDIYRYTKNHVKSIDFPHELSELDGNADFFVNLKNGNSYSFTAFTTDNIKELMHKDDLLCFTAPGLIIVRSITIQAILKAVEECLIHSFEGGIAIDHYGILQR